MLSFAINFDTARGILVSRIDADLLDAQFEECCRQLRFAVGRARLKGPLLFLSDNRGGKVYRTDRATTLWQILTEEADPADRIAILVENSLGKTRTRARSGARAQPFASENAAYIWLSAGSLIAA